MTRESKLADRLEKLSAEIESVESELSVISRNEDDRPALVQDVSALFDLGTLFSLLHKTRALSRVIVTKLRHPLT